MGDGDGVEEAVAGDEGEEEGKREEGGEGREKMEGVKRGRGGGGVDNNGRSG